MEWGILIQRQILERNLAEIHLKSSQQVYRLSTTRKAFPIHVPVFGQERMHRNLTKPFPYGESPLYLRMTFPFLETER